MKNQEPPQFDGLPEPENQVQQKKLWEALINCGFTPDEITASPFDKETPNDDDCESALFLDKAKKIMSILEPEELESVGEALQDEPCLLSNKLKGNAGLVMLLLAGLWYQRLAKLEGRPEEPPTQ